MFLQLMGSSNIRWPVTLAVTLTWAGILVNTTAR
jgi:hypothetical protein